MSKSSDPDYVCPVFATSGKCGEQDALQVMDRFRLFYERKLCEVHDQGGGDCMELKLKIQQRWIEDLTEQTQMMARIVKELEDEATTRVRMLEDKLRQTSKNAYETKEKESVLEQQLIEVRAQIHQMRPCVEMRTIYTMMDDDLEARRKERELEEEICKRQGEVEELRCRCVELEKALHNSQSRADNLQKAELRTLARAELKKLSKQNRYYEHVIDCFKHEMAVMSEQLTHLQEILNLSNQSCRDENGHLHQTVLDLKNLSDKLQQDLINTEKKMLMENQMNQIKDAKIGELQQIIGQKNADLNVHDEAIQNMKMKLENAVLENHELQATIVALNSTIMQLKCNMQAREVDHNRLSGCVSTTLDQKSKTLEILQAEYKNQYQLVKSIQQELDRVRAKGKEKTKILKKKNEELEEQILACKHKNQKLFEELAKVKEHAKYMADQDCCKEHELAQCKQIILEFRQNLIDLHESLVDNEPTLHYVVEEYHKIKVNDNGPGYGSETILCKKLVETLKESLDNSKRKLEEARSQIHHLNEELRVRDNKIIEIHRKSVVKEKEACRCIKELSEKLRYSQEEERRLSDFIDNLKQEVQHKIKQKSEIAEKQLTCECDCDCLEMVNTEEEITELKVEIKKMIQNQLALNTENDRLLNQVTSLQSTVSHLEDKIRSLKQKLEKCHSEIQNLKEKNKILIQDKENLQSELQEVRNSRDDVCAESKCVVNNVRAWLDEQKRINDQLRKKTKCYCDTISKLKQENESLSRSRSRSPTFNNRYLAPDNWCLGSQGTDMASPRDSPSSCLTCSVDEWYSPNFKDDEETMTEHEDDTFVERIEVVTNQMKDNNKKWRCKGLECMVPKHKK